MPSHRLGAVDALGNINDEIAHLLDAVHHVHIEGARLIRIRGFLDIGEVLVAEGVPVRVDRRFRFLRIVDVGDFHQRGREVVVHRDIRLVQQVQQMVQLLEHMVREVALVLPDALEDLADGFADCSRFD